MNVSIYTDGGARGNPGPGASAFVAYVGDEKIFSDSRFLGESTNNIAEYEALLLAFNWLVTSEIKFDKVEFLVDSELVVKQLKGEYRVKSQELAKKFLKIKALVQELGREVIYTHVPRGKNKEADALVNKTLNFHLKRG